MRSRTSCAISMRSSASAGLDAEPRARRGRALLDQARFFFRRSLRASAIARRQRDHRPFQILAVALRRRGDEEMRAERKLRVANARRRVEQRRQPLAHIDLAVLLADQHRDRRGAQPRVLLRLGRAGEGQRRLLGAPHGVARIRRLFAAEPAWPRRASPSPRPARPRRRVLATAAASLAASALPSLTAADSASRSDRRPRACRSTTMRAASQLFAAASALACAVACAVSTARSSVAARAVSCRAGGDGGLGLLRRLDRRGGVGGGLGRPADRHICADRAAAARPRRLRWSPRGLGGRRLRRASICIFGEGSAGCEISVGATSCGAMTTRSPIRVSPQSLAAKPAGRRMQPCEAGWPGTTPRCMATPDQVMRCMKGMGAPE